MLDQIEGVKKIELPINMISSLGNIKTAKVSDNIINGMIGYYQNTPNKGDYRQKIEDLYDNLQSIIPVDSQINDVIYLNDYIEKGIAVPTNINSLKQQWLHYRLIFNELESKKEIDKMPNESDFNVNDSYILSNFDDIFDRLSQKVDGVSQYVEELKEMKVNIDYSTNNLDKDKQILAKEKEEFEEYKRLEIRKIDKEKQELKAQVERLESLVRIFDLKISDLIKE